MANAAMLHQIVSLMVCPARLSADQVLAALEYIDSSIPDSDLRYELTSQARFKLVEDRAAHVRDGLRIEDPFTASLPGLSNSIEARLFSFSADYFVNFARADYWNVCFEQPPDALDPQQMSAFLLGLGDALGAYYGTAGTYLAATANDQLNHLKEPGFLPPHGLPELVSPQFYVSMAIPLSIYWANYWSKETADLLAFSELEHASLFYRWQRGPGGSLAFQLRSEPIALDRPEDVEALNAVYAAFPGVGGRDPRFRISNDAPDEGA